MIMKEKNSYNIEENMKEEAQINFSVCKLLKNRYTI